MSLSAAQSKQRVDSIASMLPDDPTDATATAALLLANVAVACGFSDESVHAAVRVALRQMRVGLAIPNLPPSTRRQ